MKLKIMLIQYYFEVSDLKKIFKIKLNVEFCKSWSE